LGFIQFNPGNGRSMKSIRVPSIEKPEKGRITPFDRPY
jgi:hypothetical protein